MALLSCRDTGHARVICACGAIVFECRCGAPTDEKDAWFAEHSTATTTIDRCSSCRKPKAKPGANRRKRRRRLNLTTPGRQFDARQTTRRK